jgi:DNA-binding MarR family transcriptional regulator
MAGTSGEREALDPEVRATLLAYLDAVALAEQPLAALWQSSRITLSQLTVLRWLRESGPQPAGRLAEAVGLSSTSATRLLDRLERRKLVERRRDSPDRRRVVIHLRPEGAALLGAVRLVLDTPLHRAIEAMPAVQRDRLREALAALVSATRAAADERDGTEDGR